MDLVVFVVRDRVSRRFVHLAGQTLAGQRLVPEGGQLLELFKIFSLVHYDCHSIDPVLHQVLVLSLKFPIEYVFRTLRDNFDAFNFSS